MKGLLRKELYMLWKNFRTYLVMAVVFLIFGAWSDNGFFMLFYPILLCSMIPVSILNFDEKTGWDRYSLCFPLSRSKLVAGKYLISLICSGAIFVLYSLVGGAKLLLTRDWGSGADMLALYLLIQVAIALLPPAILLPCVFKLGSQRGAYAYYAVIALLTGVIVAALHISGESNPGSLALPGVLNLSPLSVLLLALGAVALFALSWPLSARIYEKKEF